MDDDAQTLGRELRGCYRHLALLRERVRVQANVILRLRALAEAHGIREQHDRIVTQEETGG